MKYYSIIWLISELNLTCKSNNSAKYSCIICPVSLTKVLVEEITPDKINV
jgi:hypothetical protein